MLVDLQNKFDQIHEYWSPKIVGELNGQQVKLAKIKGDFPWHQHEDADELFMVFSGQLTMRFRDREEVINPGQMLVVPKGVEHSPLAYEETAILMFEPIGTLNTGNTENEYTKREVDWI